MADERGELSQKCFKVGSSIKCRYQSGTGQVEGQVAAFQNSSRLLLVRSPASNGKSTFNNVYVINADMVDKISVDDRTTPDPLKPVDFPKLEKRRNKAIELKKAKIHALSPDVTPEGRKVFLTILKTMNDVAWDGENIIVLKEVKISPPYKGEDVVALKKEKEDSATYIRKIVDNHWKEQPVST